jgi:hypothetical protein
MPLTQNPIVDWPSTLSHLVEHAELSTNEDGKCYCRIDVDVDPETLLLLNEFEARVRHRRVRLETAAIPRGVTGEMNTLIGLGAASDPALHSGKVRLSFHDLQAEA